MNPNNHPLTEARAAELWDRKLRHLVAFEWDVEWEDMNTEEMSHALIAMRASFDAGREHEREHADPHHDPRPWQDCTRDDIREGDLVETRRGDRLFVGVAHYQDRDGDWRTEEGWLLTNGDCWPLRRIPAPIPPAEEVELSDESGEVLYDVTIMNPDGSVLRTAVAMLDEEGYWMGLWSGEGDSKFDGYQPRSFTSFTLPDGTCVRRDGEHEDGTPRFVKEDS